jgi:hypothetical protein
MTPMLNAGSAQINPAAIMYPVISGEASRATKR